MSATLSTQSNTFAAQFTVALRAFDHDVRQIATLIEQPRTDIDGPARWWQGHGWDLVRTSNGDWLGWPVGHVVHPPLFGLVYANAAASIIPEVAAFGGFVVPAEMTPLSNKFELALVAFRR